MMDTVEGAPRESAAWIAKAQFYELASMGLLCPDERLAQALANGEFSRALAESANALSLGDALGAARILDSYKGRDVSGLFHALRTEYTRVFATPKHVLVSPYAGIWQAEKAGVQAVMFVNKEAMAVERFCRRCGIVRPEGSYEPLDHIGAELEFLNYLCLERAGAIAFPEGTTPPERAYEAFYADHLTPWSREFARAVARESGEPLYRAMAAALTALPSSPL